MRPVVVTSPPTGGDTPGNTMIVRSSGMADAVPSTPSLPAGSVRSGMMAPGGEKTGASESE
jgi:hypothetical protein